MGLELVFKAPDNSFAVLSFQKCQNVARINDSLNQWNIMFINGLQFYWI